MSRRRRGSDGWTVDTLKIHFDAIQAADQRYLNAMLEERDKAIKEFKDTTEKNFASRNEIQTAMKDAAASNERAMAALVSTLLPRAEGDARIARNEQDIKATTDRMNESGGFGRGVKDSWGWLVGAIGIVFGL